MPDLELLHQTPLLTVPAPNLTAPNSLAAMTSSLQAMNAASSMVALSASSLAVAAAEAQVFYSLVMGQGFGTGEKIHLTPTFLPVQII